MLRVIFGVERLFGGFCKKMLKKIPHTFRQKILGQFLPYFMNVISRYVYTLGFIGCDCC